MAYDKQTERILSGGLNLLSPSSEIPDHDCQKNVNFTWDEAASLRSRRGHTLICSASGAVLQMIKAMGGLRWQATSSSVHKACASIITVANAHIVGFKGFVWAMGAGQEPRKSSGTNNWRWIPEAPTTKCAAMTAAEVVTEIDDFTEDWDVDPAGDDTFDAMGLQIQGQAGKTYSATKEKELDLYTGFSIDDVFRVKMVARNWSDVEGVSFEVDVGDGSFENDYYRARVNVKDLKGGKRETLTIYLRKRPFDVDTDAEDKHKYAVFERIGQTAEKDWRSVVKLRVKVSFRRVTRFWFKAWDMIGNEDNQIVGDDLKYWYTYTTDAGHESNPSPPSDPINVNHGSVDLSDFEASADPQVTGMNVYTNRAGAVYRINEEALAIGNTTDTSTNDELTTLGIQLEDDHDDPPEAEGVAGPYYGRLLAWKGNRVYWTKQNRPYIFSGPDDESGGDWNELGEEGNGIKNMIVRPHRVHIYMNNTIYILTGDPGDFNGEFHESPVGMGIGGRNCVCKAGSVDYAVMNKGLYAISNGEGEQKLSVKVEPIFSGREVELDDGTTAMPITDFSTVAVGYDNGVVWISYSEQTIKLDLATGRWFQDDRLFRSFAHDAELFLAGQANGNVLILDAGDQFTDNGGAIDLDFLSKSYDVGAPDTDKTFQDLTIEVEGGTDVLDVVAYFDNGASSFAAGNISSITGRNVLKLDAGTGEGIKARSIAVGITGAVTSEIIIPKIHLNYYPERREGKTNDTDEFDAGTHKAKIVREICADIQNDANVRVTLQTDQPGFAMATRNDAGGWGTSSTRRMEFVVYNEEYYGHNLRILLNSNEHRLYGLRALIQVIGTLLHGARSEYWDSNVLDFGTERVKLAKEIEVVYSCTTAGSISVKTDIPNGNLTAITGSPFNLPATTGEETVKIRLSPDTRGRLYQFRVDPGFASDLRLEAIRINLKVVGEPNATPWGFTGLPVEASQDAFWHAVPLPPDAIG